jgi:hypothetical protein
MTTLQGRSRLPNGHAHEVDRSSGEAQCPFCGAPLGRKRLREIQTRMTAEEAERSAKREQQIRDGFAREMAKAEATKKAAIDKARREATKVADSKLKVLAANQEATINARLQAQRETLEKAKAKAVSDEKAKAYEEKLRLEEKLQELTRQLQKKTAHELGDPAEVDTLAQLEAAFSGDRVSRVVKGVKGPDILIEVVHNGAVVGKIVVDCKNHKKWSNGFTAKLRTDQLAEGADFAILSTAVFPAGARQLHVQDNVIVADPARVPVLVHLLRRQIIDNCMLKLGAEARDTKAGELYKFILSPTCDDMFDRLLKLTRDAQVLDAAEAKAHQATWMKRAELLVGVLAVREQFVSVVADIVGGGR